MLINISDLTTLIKKAATTRPDPGAQAMAAAAQMATPAGQKLPTMPTTPNEEPPAVTQEGDSAVDAQQAIAKKDQQILQEQSKVIKAQQDAEMRAQQSDLELQKMRQSMELNRQRDEVRKSLDKERKEIEEARIKLELEKVKVQEDQFKGQFSTLSQQEKEKYKNLSEIVLGKSQAEIELMKKEYLAQENILKSEQSSKERIVQHQQTHSPVLQTSYPIEANPIPKEAATQIPSAPVNPARYDASRIPDIDTKKKNLQETTKNDFDTWGRRTIDNPYYTAKGNLMDAATANSQLKNDYSVAERAGDNERMKELKELGAGIKNRENIERRMAERAVNDPNTPLDQKKFFQKQLAEHRMYNYHSPQATQVIAQTLKNTGSLGNVLSKPFEFMSTEQDSSMRQRDENRSLRESEDSNKGFFGHAADVVRDISGRPINALGDFQRDRMHSNTAARAFKDNTKAYESYADANNLSTTNWGHAKNFGLGALENAAAFIPGGAGIRPLTWAARGARIAKPLARFGSAMPKSMRWAGNTLAKSAPTEAARSMNYSPTMNDKFYIQGWDRRYTQNPYMNQNGLHGQNQLGVFKQSALNYQAGMDKDYANNNTVLNYAAKHTPLLLRFAPFSKALLGKSFLPDTVAVYSRGLQNNKSELNMGHIQNATAFKDAVPYGTSQHPNLTNWKEISMANNSPSSILAANTYARGN